MKVGTKSVLFGAHCFFLHPIFVAIAWIKLYGFPFDPRIWIAFFVHDLGYWGKPNMDGPEGETHVELGGKIMHFLFDWKYEFHTIFRPSKQLEQSLLDDGWYPIRRFYQCWGPSFYRRRKRTWYNFSLYHSRFYAKKDGAQPSKLCFADKLAMCLELDWFYLIRVNLSGEIKEYMHMADVRNLAGEHKTADEKLMLSTKSQKDWRVAVVSYVKRWVNEHLDGREDTWTPEVKKPINAEGVWQ
jgi:hypothetical protein